MPAHLFFSFESIADSKYLGAVKSAKRYKYTLR